MPRNRTPKRGTKYYIDKELYLAALHYCRQYPVWVAELSVSPDSSKAITYDKDKVQSSNGYDSTSEIAMKRHEISLKVERIERAAEEVTSVNKKWILLGACYGKSYYDLVSLGCLIPRNLYYYMRRQFYYIVSKNL